MDRIIREISPKRFTEDVSIQCFSKYDFSRNLLSVDGKNERSIFRVNRFDRRNAFAGDKLRSLRLSGPRYDNASIVFVSKDDSRMLAPTSTKDINDAIEREMKLKRNTNDEQIDKGKRRFVINASVLEGRRGNSGTRWSMARGGDR